MQRQRITLANIDNYEYRCSCFACSWRRLKQEFWSVNNVMVIRNPDYKHDKDGRIGPYMPMTEYDTWALNKTNHLRLWHVRWLLRFLQRHLKLPEGIAVMVIDTYFATNDNTALDGFWFVSHDQLSCYESTNKHYINI